jgi:hypothetical protein
MMRVSFLLTAAVILAACDTATAPRSMQSSVDDSRVPAELRAAYREDASRLALRDLQASGSNEILIPDEAVRPYYNALVLVYNATALPARDTVVDAYGIHTFPQPSTRSFFLIVAGDQVWAQRLTHDTVPTGNALIDQLLADYSLSFDHAFVLTNNRLLIVLRTAAPLNVAALTSKFADASGVLSADPNGACCDGNNIIGSIEASRILLDYSVGYGDCPSGCIGRRSYHFAVHEDGTVEYLGASGSPPPEPSQP